MSNLIKLSQDNAQLWWLYVAYAGKIQFSNILILHKSVLDTQTILTREKKYKTQKLQITNVMLL